MASCNTASHLPVPLAVCDNIKSLTGFSTFNDFGLFFQQLSLVTSYVKHSSNWVIIPCAAVLLMLNCYVSQQRDYVDPATYRT